MVVWGIGVKGDPVNMDHVHTEIVPIHKNYDDAKVTLIPENHVDAGTALIHANHADTEVILYPESHVVDETVCVRAGMLTEV